MTMLWNHDVGLKREDCGACFCFSVAAWVGVFLFVHAGVIFGAIEAVAHSPARHGFVCGAPIPSFHPCVLSHCTSLQQPASAVTDGAW